MVNDIVSGNELYRPLRRVLALLCYQMAFYQHQQHVEEKHSELVQFILKDLTTGMLPPSLLVQLML